MKHRKSLRRALYVVLFALIALLGGTGVGVLLYLDARGLLGAIVLTLMTYFNEGGKSTLILLWGLALPLLLLAFGIFMLTRKYKIEKKEEKWEAGMRAALEAERAALEAERTRDSRPRFSAPTPSPALPPADVPSLAHFCARFRDYAASQQLYFRIQDVRAFVAGLCVSHLILLQGNSGTGKTSLAYCFAKFLGTPATLIPVQPTWKERADLLGYYNEFTRQYNETQLFRRLCEAQDSPAVYLAVLDEMNLARVEYYFADFLSLLEIPDPDLRRIQVVPDAWDSDPPALQGGRLKLPENVWFVGTINENDTSYPLSDKVYDRAMALELKGRDAPFVPASPAPCPLPAERLVQLARAAQQEHTPSPEIAQKLTALGDLLAQRLGVRFGNRIEKQIAAYLPVYVACGGTEEEALDGLLAKKVLRKLEYKDLAFCREGLEELHRELDRLFGPEGAPQCRLALAALEGRGSER